MKLFTLAILMTAAFALAQAAPVNDDFANAQVLIGVNASALGTNLSATKQANEPAHARNRGGASVWYKYVAPADGVLYLNTATSNINFNTLLAVYQGTALNNLRLVAANDDYRFAQGDSSLSKVFVGAKSGDIFYIAVDGKYNEANGVTATGNINLEYEFTSVAPNDNFSAAVASSLNPNGARMHIAANVGATKEAGEPNHSNQPGGKSVWFRFQIPAGSSAKSYTFTLSSRNTDNTNSGINTMLAIYTGNSVNALTEVASGYAAQSQINRVTFTPTPGTFYYVAVDGRDNGIGAGTATFTLDYGVTKSMKEADFDSDGKTDVTVFRPSNGTWYSLDTITGNLRAFPFGASGDKPLLNDFDKDGETDYAVFRPSSGAWYSNQSTLGFRAVAWGFGTDVPLTQTRYSGGSYDVRPTVFRPENGTWFTQLVGSGEAKPFGASADIPIAADFTGDGNDEYAVFRPSNGTWYILNRLTNQYTVTQFGTVGDKPAVADYDGDGRADIAVYRPLTGNWYILNSLDNSFRAMTFGNASDKPQAADYDGEGKADIAVYRPGSGTWYIYRSSTEQLQSVVFGAGSDIPASAQTPVQ